MNVEGNARPGRSNCYSLPMLDLALIAILVVAAVLSSNVISLPTVSVTLIVTACGVLLTWRSSRAQRLVAERKLFLDLMPRRAEWYDAVKAALVGRYDERNREIDTILNGQVPGTGEHLSKLWQLETESAWLFGPEMTALMARMIETEKNLGAKLMEARQGSREAALAATRLAAELGERQGSIQEYLLGYLYVGDIGKPKRSPVKLLN